MLDLLNRHFSSLIENLVPCPLILAFKPLEGPAEKETLMLPNYTQGHQPCQVADEGQRDSWNLDALLPLLLTSPCLSQLSGAMVLDCGLLCGSWWFSRGGLPGCSVELSPEISCHESTHFVKAAGLGADKSYPITPPYMGALVSTVNPKHSIG